MLAEEVGMKSIQVRLTGQREGGKEGVGWTVWS